MRHALLAVVAAALVAGAALSARAQGEFPLKYTDAVALTASGPQGQAASKVWFEVK
ncbi:MAG: hypothetical protein NTU94_04330 [Planctomycetota bacterium]|nr:hypothetical protein [Planctomycetota bacterium]